MAGPVVPLGAMKTGITSGLDGADRARLEAIAADRNRPQKQAWRRYLSDLETGRHNRTPETIAKLAQALDVPVEWLS